MFPLKLISKCFKCFNLSSQVFILNIKNTVIWSYLCWIVRVVNSQPFFNSLHSFYGTNPTPVHALDDLKNPYMMPVIIYVIVYNHVYLNRPCYINELCTHLAINHHMLKSEKKFIHDSRIKISTSYRLYGYLFDKHECRP